MLALILLSALFGGIIGYTGAKMEGKLEKKPEAREIRPEFRSIYDLPEEK